MTPCRDKALFLLKFAGLSKVLLKSESKGKLNRQTSRHARIQGISIEKSIKVQCRKEVQWGVSLGSHYWDYCPGARFTNDFLPAIQIRWKLCLAVIPLLAIRLQQIFAHATTAQLSCHVQNFVAITVLELRWEWSEISIEFDCDGKTVSETGPCCHSHICKSFENQAPIEEIYFF